MAWSDAARAAALEARRMHSAARVKISPAGSGLDMAKGVNSWRHFGNFTRPFLAKRIKEWRAGKPAKGMEKQQVIEMARASTVIRNVYDRKKR